MNAADYFSLSSRLRSYIHVAVFIAQYDGYLYPFAEELMYNKICHWVCSDLIFLYERENSVMLHGFDLLCFLLLRKSIFKIIF